MYMRRIYNIEYVYMPLDNVHYDVKMTSFYYVRNTKNVEYDVIMYIIEWHENELIDTHYYIQHNKQ